MVEVDFKYGFPLFCRDHSMNHLLKSDSIRVSDIWSFWNFIIRKNPKCTKVADQQFMLSLLEQAKYFYEAATNAPLKSQPLLYYYSLLNMTKIAINMDRMLPFSSEYYHGIETKANYSTTLSNAQVNILKKDPAHDKYSVAYELMKRMGCTLPAIPPKAIYYVKDLLSNCIGVHRTYCEVYNINEHFFRVDSMSLYKSGRRLFAKGELKGINHDVCSRLKSKGYKIIDEIDEDGTARYFWISEWVMPRYGVTLSDYYNLSQSMINQGVWTYTDGDEYRIFISDNSIGLTTECVIYSLMFFFGSITRYNPNIFDSLLTDRDYWMISEFLKTQPAQFLALLTSKITGHPILKPRTAGVFM